MMMVELVELKRCIRGVIRKECFFKSRVKALRNRNLKYSFLFFSSQLKTDWEKEEAVEHEKKMLIHYLEARSRNGTQIMVRKDVGLHTANKLGSNPLHLAIYYFR